MDIFRILASILGGNVAFVSCLNSCLQIISLGVLIVLAVGALAVVYRNFVEFRH